MSEVISFRLNIDNLREAKALLVLQEWRTQGYSIRQTITEALLTLDKNGEDLDATALNELNETLSQVSCLIKIIESGNLPSGATSREIRENGSLSANFVASVKESAKPGLKIE